MATATTSAPNFLTILNALPDDKRVQAVKRTHVDYDTHILSWEVLLDAFEADGGFLDGSYLWPYPREAETEFTDRQKMARYHNYVETLVDIYVRQVFTQSVKRTSDDQAYNEWTEDVDGAGTPLNELMKRYAAMALNGGHAGVLVDKTRELPTGPRLADESARVFLTVFPNVSITDWRFKGNELVGVKLLEAAPPLPLVTEDPTFGDPKQYLLWDMDGWARFDQTAEFLDADLTLKLGMVPLIILRPKPSHISQMLGRPLIGNANVVRALFNRSSEEDQVLRDQAFSVLTCSVDKDGSVDEARQALGNVIGTAKALVVKGQLDYKTPSMEVPQAIRDNMAFLVQEMYRAAHVRYQRDSLQAESAEAIRLTHTELNEMLQGLGHALADAERKIARAYYAWTTPTEQAAEEAFNRADPRATYPEEFFLDALGDELDAWAKAIEMDLGLEMTHRIKKKAVRRIEPDMPQDELEKVDAEIDAQKEEPKILPTDLGADAFGGVNPNAIQ